jgi:hypothetical protein
MPRVRHLLTSPDLRDVAERGVGRLSESADRELLDLRRVFLPRVGVPKGATRAPTSPRHIKEAAEQRWLATRARDGIAGASSLLDPEAASSCAEGAISAPFRPHYRPPRNGLFAGVSSLEGDQAAPLGSTTRDRACSFTRRPEAEGGQPGPDPHPEVPAAPD